MTKKIRLKKLFEATHHDYHVNYNDIVSEKSELARKAKDFYQTLYETYQKNEWEEANFLDGVQKQWYSRIWEMYFTCELAELGFKISCPKGDAPDIKLEIGDQVIWIECTVISKGEYAVIEHVDDEVHVLNDENYILRITSALDYKVKQIQKHKKSGIIGDNDIILIAINTGELILVDIAQDDYPLIQKALYGIDPMIYNWTTQEVKNLHRPKIAKSEYVSIQTNKFTTTDYKDISGVIFSNWKTTQIEKKLKDDFELTHNLFAKNKLTKHFFKIGTEYLPYIKNNKGEGEFEKIMYK